MLYLSVAATWFCATRRMTLTSVRSIIAMESQLSKCLKTALHKEIAKLLMVRNTVMVRSILS